MKKLFFAVVLTIVSIVINAQPKNETISKIAESSLEYYGNIYRTIHSNPELSLCEKETSALVAKEMKRMGLEVHEGFGGYGVVGIFRNGDGPVVLLRADMDALPIKEATGLPFASTKMCDVNGVQTPAFHACGHDVHTTVMLGTVNALVSLKKGWKGTLIALAEPAEEVGKGAHGIIDAGLFTKFPIPDYVLAYHVFPDSEVGSVEYSKGPAMAGVKDYDITFKGKGAHGAYPHEGIDPIVMAANAVLEYQTIVSRSVKAFEPAVVTVGAFNSGSRPNIINEKAYLKITARFFNEEVGNLIDRRIREITNAVAKAAGATDDMMPEIEMISPLPPVINNSELVDKVVVSMKNILGEANVHENNSPSMAAEDFSLYRTASPKVQAAMFSLGVSPKGKHTTALHSPTFKPEFDGAYITGVQAMTRAIIDLMVSK